MASTFVKEFIEQSVYRIEESTNRIKKCLAEIDDAQTWRRPNDNLNSVGNLIVHLCGNIRQYIISALGEKKDIRDRNKEFSIREGPGKEGLFDELVNTVAEAVSILKNIDEARLTKIYSVQGFSLSGIGIIIHVTEHYSYHTGQIAFWTKQLKNKDLGFYANVDLNVKNSN
jgi:uncharacterized damage-inducible protein DinB